MFRTWRRAAVAAVVGGAAIAAQLAGVASAQAAAPAITITAASRLPRVTGDVWVVYRAGAYSSARIHGAITDVAAGDVATLYAQRFPYTRPPAPAGSHTFTVAGTRSYSFQVTPTLATRYQVKLSAPGAPGRPLATSPTQNVYVVPNGYVTGGRTCARPTCRETFHLFTILPSSALSVEMSKHVYPYFGLNLSPTVEPPPPAWLYLNAGHASVTGTHRIAADAYEATLTFTFTIGNDGYRWDWTGCTRDTVFRDGLGLPGYHNCGASRVPGSGSYYLG
jgi:hypothetical protein